MLRQRYFDIYNDESANELSFGTDKRSCRRGNGCVDVVFADDCDDYVNPNGATWYDSKGVSCKDELFAAIHFQSTERTRESVIGDFMQD